MSCRSLNLHKLCQRLNRMLHLTRRNGLLILFAVTANAVMFSLIPVALPSYLEMLSFPYATSSPSRNAKTEAQLLADECRRFNSNVGRYPTDLTELIVKPKKIEASIWRGPYLDYNVVPFDPWGNRYQLITQRENVFVISAGEDGVLGSRDDIRSK